MERSNFKIGFIWVTFALIIGCSPQGSSLVQDSAVGALGGTAIGAGTGALIGNAIANGDVAKSALVGGAIGLPVGLLAGAAISTYNRESAVRANRELIETNQAEIYRQQDDLDTTRNDLERDAPEGVIDPAQRGYNYLGKKSGNPFR